MERARARRAARSALPADFPAAGVAVAVFAAGTYILAGDSTAVTDLDGVGLSISSGALTFAPAEIGAATWLDNADRTWTFDIAAGARIGGVGKRKRSEVSCSTIARRSRSRSIKF